MNLKHRLHERSEIYLFEWPKLYYGNLPHSVKKDLIDTHAGPKVHEFLSFLKYFKIPKPYKFATITSENNLINTLTLKENILMKLNCESLTNSKDREFEEIMESFHNPYLPPILELFTEGNLRSEEASKEANKTAQLLSALLSDVQFIFMESPEKDLSFKMFSHFLKAIKFHCHQKNVNIFISSANPELWTDEAQYYIQRDDQLGFSISEISKKKNLAPLKTNDNESPTLNFVLPKPPSKNSAA